jgi:ParB family chromosome partitioning protein
LKVDTIMEKRPALGKGLSALIPDVPEPRSSPVDVDIDRLAPNDFQPRAQVDDTHLRELAQSIKANGVIQPIVVRRMGDHFQIIAGERRWRAAKLAGLRRVPIAVREVAPGQEQSLLEMALVENIQREDLNPIEEALAYRRLADDFHLKQEDIASAVGKDRASVANYLRLLRLPDEVRTEVASGRLSMGHARSLLSLTDEADQRQIARDVIARSLSVRETESLVKKIVERGISQRRPRTRDDPRHLPGRVREVARSGRVAARRTHGAGPGNQVRVCNHWRHRSDPRARKRRREGR